MSNDASNTHTETKFRLLRTYELCEVDAYDEDDDDDDKMIRIGVRRN